jgi:phosphopantetheinyl transferase
MLRVAVARVAEALAFGVGGAPTWLGASECQRWATLAPRGRPAFVAARLLVRQLLEDVSGLAASRWQVSAELNAAPVATVRDAAAARFDEETAPFDAPPPHVSLSHRLGWVAAAAVEAACGPVGIDIECERLLRSDVTERAALMLADCEQERWNALPESERDAALLHSWAAKEAWFKASPAGSAPWSFRRIALRACDPADANVRVWSAATIQVAVCCADAALLQATRCEGLPADTAGHTSFWRVARVD